MFHKGIYKYLHLSALIYIFMIKMTLRLSLLQKKPKNYLWKPDPITMNIDMFTESIKHICFFKAFL